MTSSDPADRFPRLIGGIAAILLAVGLAYLFWRPLWHGGGLVGGDLYSYFFPQKAFYADELQAGRLPLWNPLVGHGYPVVAESQTGVFYPPNLLLYSWLDVNTAYNAQQIGHYILAFLATWLLARRLGLQLCGAALAALVFVYSWFAARICLEWAIIGGVYLPLLAWCAESFLQTGRRRYLAAMSIGLAMHLLAGHFNLAFIEVLCVAAYSALRIALPSRDASDEATTAAPVTHLPQASPARGARALTAIGISLAIGFSLAAVQLAPTWELKQRSQRADVGARHDPGYGHLPPWYLIQVVTPWMWYAPDVNADEALSSIHTLSIPSSTNKVEAHLYFGLLPLALASSGLIVRWRNGSGTPAPLKVWLLLGLAAVVYATGWLLPITRHLPGFSFFMGPGRYGIVTTLAVALLAGFTLDRCSAGLRSAAARALLFAAVFGLTLFDLWTVRIGWIRTTEGAPNWYADMVPDPPINHRHESEVRRVLSEYPGVPRMYGPFQNMPTLTGFAMTPVYLGLGPAEYFDPALTMPKLKSDSATAAEISFQVDWLQRAGVTHILSEHALDAGNWPVTLAWQGFDPLLHRAWARQEPLYLYELLGSRGRVSVGGEAGETAEIGSYESGRVSIEIDGGRSGTAVVTDLAYPGWDVSVNGVRGTSEVIEGMYRGVAVPAGPSQVIWTYTPGSLTRGALLSGASLVGLAVWCAMARRRSARGARPG